MIKKIEDSRELVFNEFSRLHLSKFSRTSRCIFSATQIKKDDDYLDGFEHKIKNGLKHQRDLISGAYGAVGNWCFTLDKIGTAFHMANIYPWRSTKISKAQHLELCWHYFTNQCYIFEERTKVVGKRLSALSKYNKGPKIDVGNIIKREIKPALEPYLEFRGRHVHEWPQPIEPLQLFSQFELLNEFDGSFQRYMKELYLDSKHEIKSHIADVSTVISKIIFNNRFQTIHLLEKYLKAFEKILMEYEPS